MYHRKRKAKEKKKKTITKLGWLGEHSLSQHYAQYVNKQVHTYVENYKFVLFELVFEIPLWYNLCNKMLLHLRSTT